MAARASVRSRASGQVDQPDRRHGGFPHHNHPGLSVPERLDPFGSAGLRGLPYSLSGYPNRSSGNHHGQQYVWGRFRPTGIESFWASLARCVYGTWHKFGAKHLRHYVAECAAQLRYAPPAAQLDRCTACALTSRTDQSVGARQASASPFLYAAARRLDLLSEFRFAGLKSLGGSSILRGRTAVFLFTFSAIRILPSLMSARRRQLRSMTQLPRDHSDPGRFRRPFMLSTASILIRSIGTSPPMLLSFFLTSLQTPSDRTESRNS